METDQLRTSSEKALRTSNVALLTSVLCAALFLMMSVGGFDAGRADPKGGYYQRLSMSFLDGRLSLKDEPQAGLLNLGDPYDPAQNAAFRTYGIHDSVLHNEKLYYYWGPGVVLFVTAPAHLFGLTLTETDIGRWGGATLCLLLGCLLQQMFRTKNVSRSSLAAVTAALLVTSPLFLLATRLGIWEANVIAATNCQILAVLAFYLSRVRPSTQACFWITMSSLAIALAILIRTESLLLVPILFLGYRDWTTMRKRRAKWTLLAPAASIMMLGLYNRLRFGKFSDFGVQEILAGADQRGISLSSIKYVLPNLRTYLFDRPSISRIFPFLKFDRVKLAVNLPASEVVGGLVWTVPWVIVALLVIIVRYARRTTRSSVDKTSGVLMSIGVCQLLFISYAIFGASARYMLSPTILIGLGGALALLDWGPMRSKPGRVLLPVVLAPSIAVGGLAAAHGYYPDQVPKNKIFEVIRGATEPIVGSVGRSIDPENATEYNACLGASRLGSQHNKTMLRPFPGDVFRFVVSLPRSGWTGYSPLLVLGQAGAADVVGVAWNGYAARFMHDHWRHAPIVGPEVSLSSQQAITVTIALRANREGLDIFANGERVLSSEVNLYSSIVNSYGENQIGASTVNEHANFDFRLLDSGGTQQCIPGHTKSEVVVGSCLVTLDYREIAGNLEIRALPDNAVRVKLRRVSVSGAKWATLFSAGRTQAGDVIGLTLTGDRIQLIHDHWGAPPIYSPKLQLSQQTELVFTLIRSESGTKVFANGQLLLASPTSFYDVRGRVAFGRNTIGATTVNAGIRDLEPLPISHCDEH